MAWSDTHTKVYELNRVLFGFACSPTLAQYVKNTNAERYKEQYPEAVLAICKQHYVDDYLDSRDTPEEVLKLATEVKLVHQGGGFHITKWQSNDDGVTRALGGEVDKVIEVSSTSVLGMNWDTSNDCLYFRWRVDSNKINGSQLPTKRQLLRMAMSIFDPLGLVAYITILARIILREAWRVVIEWDQEIPSSCRQAWEEWIEMLKHLANIRVPRWYKHQTNCVDLHIFSDASEAAIASVAYTVSYGEETVITLVMAKSKVAPLKTKSIPRLELEAAVSGYGSCK